MAVRSIQDHVQSLIGRTVAEAKVDGVSPSNIEARAILESIALSMLLKPRSILYLANLARNGLQSIITKEIAAIDSMSATVNDLGNLTFTPASSQHLNDARVSLLQMEGLAKVDTTSGVFQRFSKSVDDFLNKSLAKNVRKPGATDLARPDTEAAQDLPNDFAVLKDIHSEMNSRLYLLSVGVQNFTSSPLGTILGLSTAYRARTDIEDVISIIDGGNSGSQSRDIAIRLIGDRAALKSVGTLPSLNDPLLDTLRGLPSGYVLTARSDAAPATTTSKPGPFVFAPGASASVTVNGTTLTTATFPQLGTDLNNRAFIVSEFRTYPVTIPAAQYLFVHFRRLTAAAGYDLQSDGTYLKQIRVSFTSGSRTLVQVLADLNAALGADGAAYEYLKSGTRQILIVGNSSISTVMISPSHMEPGSGSVGNPSFYYDSLHTVLGFSLSQRGDSGQTPLTTIIDAINAHFGALVLGIQLPTGQARLTTIATSVGTSMVLAFDASLTLTGTFYAISDSIKLYGTVFGKDPTPVPGDVPTPVDPNPLLDVGDTLLTPFGSQLIKNLSLTRIILQNPVRTFDGEVVGTSALVLAYQLLDAALTASTTAWLNTPYAQDLTTLDRAVAVLRGKVTNGTRGAVKDILTDLRSKLVAMQAALASGPVLSTSATDERVLVNGIISTLTERKYDRALSLLLKLDIQNFFGITGDTASFGGALLQAMATLAQTDIKFPNTQNDEGSGFKGVVEGPKS